MAQKQPDEKLFDVRVVDRHIRRGVVTADTYAKYLDALPDDAEHAEPVKVQFTPQFADKHYRR